MKLASPKRFWAASTKKNMTFTKPPDFPRFITVGESSYLVKVDFQRHLVQNVRWSTKCLVTIQERTEY